MKLYSYFRSTAAYRVRIALQFKNLEHDIVPVNLLDGKQFEATYLDENPQARVPTLTDDGLTIGQSMAMLEYLEEKYPEPPLLPKDPEGRAWIRYVANIVACDIHPLNNSGVINYLKKDLSHDQNETTIWYHHWLRLGFDALENLLVNNPNTSRCCWGDDVTFADLCLIPQIYNAHRFNFPMDNYPLLNKINEYCLGLPYFEKARPENQADFV